MSDLHHLPLTGHDAPYRPAVRAQVRQAGRRGHWMWAYKNGLFPDGPALWHGPFASWREAYDSARRMVELL